MRRLDVTALTVPIVSFEIKQSFRYDTDIVALVRDVPFVFDVPFIDY